MKNPECVKKKVKIPPHDYSKENYLATFTPQKQLTPKQIFWSKDLTKMKAEALKEQTPATRPIKVFMVFTEMHDAHTVVQARCLELEVEISKLNDKIQKDDHNELVKRFYNLETTVLLTKNKNLKVQINEKMKCVTTDSVTPKVLAPGMYDINVAPLPPRCRNNMEVYLNYLKHLKESVATLREIVEETRAARPLDRSLDFAYHYTKHSQELLEYAVCTCPKDFNK
nr:retrovirus-related Pol polyprotein from transposon TNT 1-94 [Tanacetum cinerariifolium]